MNHPNLLYIQNCAHFNPFGVLLLVATECRASASCTCIRLFPFSLCHSSGSSVHQATGSPRTTTEVGQSYPPTMSDQSSSSALPFLFGPNAVAWSVFYGAFVALCKVKYPHRLPRRSPPGSRLLAPEPRSAVHAFPSRPEPGDHPGGRPRSLPSPSWTPSCAPLRRPPSAVSPATMQTIMGLTSPLMSPSPRSGR